MWRYWRTDHGNDATKYEFNPTWPNHHDAAQDAADDYHSNHDGWEASWPVDFSVESPDGVVKSFSVDREARPEFYVREEISNAQ
jgi:hypothetical protein